MGSRNEDEAVSGEVMTVEEKKRMAVREKHRGPIVGAIFSRLSKVPFINVWLEKKVSTSRKVVREETGLFDDLVKHDQSFTRLLDIDVIRREDSAVREAAATAAENKLAAEKRIAAARERDDAIYAKKKEYEQNESEMKLEYELRKLKANYKIQLDPLEKAVEKLEKPPLEPKKKTTRGRSPKQKARDDAQKKYEREIARIEKDNKLSAEAKEDLKKSAAKDREVELEKSDKMP